MGDIIKWVDYEKPKKVFDKLFNSDIDVSGEYICSDDRVEKFWIVGSVSAKPDNNDMMCRGIIMFKDGKRWDTKSIVVTEDNFKTVNEELVSEAENYLKEHKN